MLLKNRCLSQLVSTLGGLVLMLALAAPAGASIGAPGDLAQVNPRVHQSDTQYEEITRLANTLAPAETEDKAPDVEEEREADITQSDVSVAEDQLPVFLLGDIVAAAIEHSPGLAAMQWQAISGQEQSDSVAGYGGLKSELSITGMQTNSPLGVFASKLSQGRVTQMDFDPAALNDPDYFGNMEYKLMLMYPLFNSGRIKLLSDAVALNANAIDFDALAREHELTTKVIEAYFNYALLDDQLLVLDEATLTVDELKRLIEQLYDEGLVIGSDIAAADVQLANLADEVNRAQTYRGLIIDTLGILTGGAYAGEFAPEIPLAILDEPVPDLGEITILALESRPDLNAMSLRVCAATNVLDEAIKKRNPVVGVFAEGKHSSADLWDNGHNEVTFGAQLLLDLDTGRVIDNEIEQKRADLQAAQLALEQLQELAQIEVAQAHAEVVIARQSIETFGSQAERAAENLRVVKNRYREGLTNYLDLRMAITQHKESRLRQVKAKHDYLLAYLRLLQAAGLTGTAEDPFLGGAESGDMSTSMELELPDCMGGNHE
ncbi:TolC family protein [bacterium]|nr:TolC family protein [bacterium]